MSSVFRSMSRRSTNPKEALINSEEVNYPKIPNEVDNWKLPKFSNQEIIKNDLLSLGELFFGGRWTSKLTKGPYNSSN